MGLHAAQSQGATHDYTPRAMGFGDGEKQAYIILCRI
jgi:hypothetical protein